MFHGQWTLHVFSLSGDVGSGKHSKHSSLDHTVTRWKMFLHCFVKVVARIPRPLPNQTKLKFDQDVEFVETSASYFELTGLLVEKKKPKPSGFSLKINFCSEIQNQF